MGKREKWFSRKENRGCFCEGGRQFDYVLFLVSFTPLSANPTKWSNTLKQFVGKSQLIVSVCLTIFWDWQLKGYSVVFNHNSFTVFYYSFALSQLLLRNVRHGHFHVFKIYHNPFSLSLWSSELLVTICSQPPSRFISLSRPFLPLILNPFLQLPVCPRNIHENSSVKIQITLKKVFWNWSERNNYQKENKLS